MISLSQLDIDGVRGISSAVAEKSVEVEAVGGPVGGKLSGVAFGVAGDRVEEDACTESGAVSEEVEIIGRSCIARMQAEVEGQVQGVALVKVDGGETDFRHRAITEDNVRKIDVAVCGETVFVEFAEVHIGAQMLSLRVAVETNGVGCGHVRGETHNLDKGTAVGLLRLGARIGHMGGHGTLALLAVDNIENLVA